MAKITTAAQLAAKAKEVAKNYKTLYVMGCFGAPMTSPNKARYCINHSYNKQEDRTAMIKAASADTFGFDCVCFIKGLLWGWDGDKAHIYGGAVYKSNNVPDIDADVMIKACKDVSTDFSKIEVGEAVWMKGHIGIYIGDGLAVECTPSWKNCVQITACNCNKSGYNRRDWTKHGKLPYVTYNVATEKKETVFTGKINGYNVIRKADFLVVYNKGSNANTNEWGTEVAVNASGIAICAPVYGKGKMSIPAGGYVISGHGTASKWILESIKKGSKITISGNIIKVGAVAKETLYTVKNGDSLWAIATKLLGKGSRYTEIKTLNGLKSDFIAPGQVLKIPAK